MESYTSIDENDNNEMKSTVDNQAVPEVRLYIQITPHVLQTVLTQNSALSVYKTCCSASEKGLLYHNYQYKLLTPLVTLATEEWSLIMNSRVLGSESTS